MPQPYYHDDRVALYHGDCREVLPALGVTVDVTITDPPYDDTTHQGARRGSSVTPGEIASVQGIGFDAIDPGWVAPLLLQYTKRWVVAFCALQQLGDYKTAAQDAWVRAGTWHKVAGAPQFTGDRPAQGCDGLAILHRPGKKHWNGGGRQAHWSFTTERSKFRVHPTQKPVPLMSELVFLFSDVNEVVLDPFAGGGTTLVAAKRYGRRAIGIEMDERFCESAARRLMQRVLDYD